MEFSEVIKAQQIDPGAVAPTEIETPAVLTKRDIPAGMPMTNRLDKLTSDQAVCALRNGEAWIAYLKANGGEIYQSTGASSVEITPTEQFKAICDTHENVWLVLTGNMARADLGDSGMGSYAPVWVSVLPAGEHQRGASRRNWITGCGWCPSKTNEGNSGNGGDYTIIFIWKIG